MSRKKRRQHGAESKDYSARARHHLTPRSRGGDNSPENLLLLGLDKHFYWHALFGTASLEEVITLLLRVHSIKHRCIYKELGTPDKCYLTEGLCLRRQPCLKEPSIIANVGVSKTPANGHVLRFPSQTSASS